MTRTVEEALTHARALVAHVRHGEVSIYGDAGLGSWDALVAALDRLPASSPSPAEGGLCACGHAKEKHGRVYRSNTLLYDAACWTLRKSDASEYCGCNRYEPAAAPARDDRGADPFGIEFVTKLQAEYASVQMPTAVNALERVLIVLRRRAAASSGEATALRERIVGAATQANRGGVGWTGYGDAGGP